MEGARHARRGDHGVGPPHQGVPHQPSTCLIRHLTQDWLLHPSLMSLRCGSSPPHIMSNGFTDWLFHPSLMSLWSGTSAPHNTHTQIMSNLFTEWLLKSDVTVEWNLSPHIMSNLFMNWPLHLKLMSPCAGFHSSLLHNSSITVLKTGSSIPVSYTHLTLPTIDDV